MRRATDVVRLPEIHLALLLALLPRGALAATAGDRTERLNRQENVRYNALLRLVRNGERATVPKLPGAGAPAEGVIRAGEKGRAVEVNTSASLARALADAGPGDVIRMADGVYRGNFIAEASGTSDAPITLCGSRAAILDGGSTQRGYGFHLRADHWVLAGFSIRNARKGLMADGARHNILRGLEVFEIGEEGVHLRRFSQDNVIERCWVHDVGRMTPLLGEGIYLGSAVSNWESLTGGKRDESDRNEVLGNLVGPGVTAECVDAKEGTTGGVIHGNVFLANSATIARSWVDLKGNEYSVRDNSGTSTPASGIEQPVRIVERVDGWALGNVVGEHVLVEEEESLRQPFRAAFGPGPATIVLPGRKLPYTIVELEARFPASLERVAPEVVLAREHLLACPGATLTLSSAQLQELRLLSGRSGFVSVVGARAAIRLAGTAESPVRIHSWDPEAHGPDQALEDGRAYIVALGGRMDLEHVATAQLGFGEKGWSTGVAWKGRPESRVGGDVAHSRFEHNRFGAYTFEAEGMKWLDNVFARNLGYGFDPHDFSDRFLVEGNSAYENGSHGIIFSRGCSGNTLRANRVHSNAGNGIMLDDGKVADDGDPRHERAVPSNDNVIESNDVRGNIVGIAFEGGHRNVVRDNQIHDNEFGIRLAEDASGNRIEGNRISGSKVFAIHIFDRSDHNQVLDNHIEKGQGGIVVEHSEGNVVERNHLGGIAGKGIVLSGRVPGSGVRENVIAGRGPRAIDLGQARGIVPAKIAANRTLRWLPSGGNRPAWLVWGVILLVPLLVGLPVRLALLRSRARSRDAQARRMRGLAVAFALLSLPAAPPAAAWAAQGRSVQLDFTVAGYFDDNILHYSAEQILDLGSGLHPYRFGIQSVDDWVLHPTVAVLWRDDRGPEGVRVVRLEAEGHVHRTNGVANVGELGAAWLEGFRRGRRLRLEVVHSPDSYVRRLYDSDLRALPTPERYRDASADQLGGTIAWRQPAPSVSWVELAYEYDRRRYSPEFRERDSDTHRGELGVGWERLPRAGRFQVFAGYSHRDSRAEDGIGTPGADPDESYQGADLDLRGGVIAGRVARLLGTVDARVQLGFRRFDSTRPADASHVGRRDRFLGFELGLSTRITPASSLRGFYRHERNRAEYGASDPTANDVGGYRVNRVGLELEWAGELWRRSSERPMVAR